MSTIVNQRVSAPLVVRRSNSGPTSTICRPVSQPRLQCQAYYNTSHAKFAESYEIKLPPEMVCPCGIDTEKTITLRDAPCLTSFTSLCTALCCTCSATSYSAVQPGGVLVPSPAGVFRQAKFTPDAPASVPGASQAFMQTFAAPAGSDPHQAGLEARRQVWDILTQAECLNLAT